MLTDICVAASDESMHFRVKDDAFIKVSEDGHSIRGVSYGKILLYSDDIKV